LAGRASLLSQKVPRSDKENFSALPFPASVLVTKIITTAGLRMQLFKIRRNVMLKAMYDFAGNGSFCSGTSGIVMHQELSVVSP
jgi:hypothetical protein